MTADDNKHDKTTLCSHIIFLIDIFILFIFTHWYNLCVGVGEETEFSKIIMILAIRNLFPSWWQIAHLELNKNHSLIIFYVHVFFPIYIVHCSIFQIKWVCSIHDMFNVNIDLHDLFHWIRWPLLYNCRCTLTSQ